MRIRSIDNWLLQATPNIAVHHSSSEHIRRWVDTIQYTYLHPLFLECVQRYLALVRFPPDQCRSHCLPSNFSCQDLLQGHILMISKTDKPIGIFTLITFPSSVQPVKVVQVMMALGKTTCPRRIPVSCYTGSSTLSL